MKKIITVLLSVLLIAGLFTGCNGDAVEELFRGNTPTPTPEPAETVVISFDANGGTVTRAMDSMTVEKGSEVNLPDVAGAFEAPYGYQFASWNTKADGSGTSYNATTPAYTFENNVTLYAQWNPVPFKFVAEDPNVKIYMYDYWWHDIADLPEFPLNLEYSTDGVTYLPYTFESVSDAVRGDEIWEGEVITLTNIGDEVYFRSADVEGAPLCDGTLYNFKFDITGKTKVEGNIMYLIGKNGDLRPLPDYCFQALFVNDSDPTCAEITSVPYLPATGLGNGCYEDMFKGCKYITKAPVLPATIMKNECYSGMFQNCIGLTEVPSLLSVELADQCYNCMFNGCTSLTSVPEDLLPATELRYKCYAAMFSGCTSLVKAPYLPAETRAATCYYFMFNGCSSLSEIKVNFDTWPTEPTDNSTIFWVEGVALSGTFICPSALPEEHAEDRIPTGWLVETF